jgi:methyl-accepting chemotaxis protein/hemerythrin
MTISQLSTWCLSLGGVMPLLTSSNRNLVGVASIDDGHGAIIGIINDLHAAMLRGKAEGVVCGILDRLLDFTQKHLSVEESLLESSGYPELARHRARHQELTNGIKEFVLRHKRSDKDVIVHLARFLWDWLSIHVRQEDRESGRWLKQQGVC